MSDYKYKRVLLKISGEALVGDGDYGIDPKMLESLAQAIKPVYDNGAELAVVVGGGNIYRGLAGAATCQTEITLRWNDRRRPASWR